MTYTEAQEDQERLAKQLNRDIEIRPTQCRCCGDWKFCPSCEGRGLYFDLYFKFCDHLVGDADQIACEDDDCAERERLSVLMSKTDHLDPFPVQHPQLKSLREVQSERESEVLV